MSLAYSQPSPEALADEQTREQRADRLLRVLKNKEEGALGYAQTEVTQQQIKALQRYFGEPYGDEEEGRSQVCTREVFETIEWTRPDLMRVFASGGNVVYLEETSEADSRYAKDAADYLTWMFFSDNPGYELLDDFAFDGLLHRRGYLACYWCDYEYAAPQTLTGLNIMQVQQLMQDQSVGIVGQDFDAHDEASEVGGISLIVRRVKSPARAVIKTIAPEDMRLDSRAVTLDDAAYVGCVQRMLRGEAARKWPEKAQEISEYSGPGMDLSVSTRSSEVRQERFADDNFSAWTEDSNEAAQEVEILEEYLRIDLNDDGYPEMIRSYRLGDLLLEESEVEENPFASWTPIRIPHRFMGLSQHDIVEDLQRRSTVLTRAALDAVYQAVVTREAYDTTKINADGELALTSTASGTKIPVTGNPADAIVQLSGGVDTSKVAFEALNQMSVTLENRTGATRQTQGIDPDALLKGAHSGRAIDLLQTAGGARKEAIARNMAIGLSIFFSKLYRLVCRNQNAPRAAKVGGKWAQFDPRSWNSDLRVMVHTGLGTGNRDQTMAGLNVIAQFQDTIIEKLGPDNPLVTSEHIHRTFEEMCRALGYRSADGFMAEPQQVPEQGPDGQPVIDPQTGQPKTKAWAPPPQPSPEMAKVQADAQAAQAKLAQDAQSQEATRQLEQLKAAAAVELQSRKDQAALQAQQEKAALDLQLAREKASAEIALAREKATAEIELAWAKFEAETALAREKMQLEADLAREQIESREAMHSEKVESDVKISQNRPGGALDE